jgi:hypothetical protein
VFGILDLNSKRKKRLNESSQLNKTGKSQKSGGNNTSGPGNKSGSTADNTMVTSGDFELLGKEDLDNLDMQHNQRK